MTSDEVIDTLNVDEIQEKLEAIKQRRVDREEKDEVEMAIARALAPHHYRKGLGGFVHRVLGGCHYWSPFPCTELEDARTAAREIVHPPASPSPIVRSPTEHV